MKFESSYAQDLNSNQILDCVIANKTSEKKLNYFKRNKSVSIDFMHTVYTVKVQMMQLVEV